jgi:hypothetical protein
MNRALIGLCFLLLACGEVVPIEGSGDGDGGMNVDGGGDGVDAGNSGDPCAGPTIALENVEQCFLEFQCEFMTRCFPGFPNEQFCRPRLFDFFALLNGGDGGGNGGDGGPTPLLFDIFQRATTAGVTNYDGANAFACIDKMKRLSCGSEGGGVDECEYILNSDAPTGSVCHDDFECKVGDYCLGDQLETCSINGTCRTGRDVGQSCNIDRCKPHLSCVRLGGGGGGNQSTCQDGSMGSPCSESRECDAAFFCGNNQCVPKLPLGANNCTLSEQCSGDEQCVGGSCSPVNQAGQVCAGVCWGNLFCNESGVCQAMPGQGQDCSQVPDTGLGQCDSVDLVCNLAQECAPRAPDGAACGAVGAPSPCQLGLFCTSELGEQPGQCAQPVADGGRCNSPTHCESGFCGGDVTNQQCETYTACWE